MENSHISPGRTVILTASKKQTVIVTIICLAVALAALITGIIHEIAVRDYITVKAKITDVFTEYNNSSDDSGRDYCVYEFQFENEFYMIKKQVFSTFGKKTGSYANLRVNPKNPQEFNNDLRYILSDIVGGFALLTALVLTLGLKQAKNKYARPNL